MGVTCSHKKQQVDTFSQFVWINILLPTKFTVCFCIGISNSSDAFLSYTRYSIFLTLCRALDYSNLSIKKAIFYIDILDSIIRNGFLLWNQKITDWEN